MSWDGTGLFLLFNVTLSSAAEASPKRTAVIPRAMQKERIRDGIGAISVNETTSFILCRLPTRCLFIGSIEAKTQNDAARKVITFPKVGRYAILLHDGRRASPKIRYAVVALRLLFARINGESVPVVTHFFSRLCFFPEFARFLRAFPANASLEPLRIPYGRG